jgi:uncharacterized protein YbaR (Trm112 family)
VDDPSPPTQSPTFRIDPAVLALLRCPRTGAPLRVEIRQGRSVLATDDGCAVYDIIGGIPILLPDSATLQTEARAPARAPDEP